MYSIIPDDPIFSGSESLFVCNRRRESVRHPLWMWSLQPSNWPLAKYWTNGGGAYFAFKNEWSIWILVSTSYHNFVKSRSAGVEQQLQLWAPSSMWSAAMTVLRTWPPGRSTTPSTTTGPRSPPWAQSAHALALPRSMVSCTAAVATTAPPVSQALSGSTLLLGSGHLALPWALEGAIAGSFKHLQKNFGC